MKWFTENWFKLSILILAIVFIIGSFFTSYQKGRELSKNQAEQTSKSDNQEASQLEKQTIIPEEVTETNTSPSSATPITTKTQTTTPPPVVQEINFEQFTKDDNYLSARNDIINRQYYVDPGRQKYCQVIFDNKVEGKEIYWTFSKDYAGFVSKYSQYQNKFIEVSKRITEYKNTIQWIREGCADKGIIF